MRSGGLSSPAMPSSVATGACDSRARRPASTSFQRSPTMKLARRSMPCSAAASRRSPGRGFRHATPVRIVVVADADLVERQRREQRGVDASTMSRVCVPRATSGWFVTTIKQKSRAPKRRAGRRARPAGSPARRGWPAATGVPSRMTVRFSTPSRSRNTAGTPRLIGPTPTWAEPPADAGGTRGDARSPPEGPPCAA